MSIIYQPQLFSNPDPSNLPATQYDARNVTSTRFIELGGSLTGAALPAGTPPSEVEISIAELLGLYSYDPSRTARIVTIGLESYSFRRVAVVPEIDREPIALVCDQIQQFTQSRYLALLPIDFGQGLAYTSSSISLTGNQVPTVLKFRLGLLTTTATDNTLYHFNSGAPFANQAIREFTVRLFVRASYEPNQVPVAGRREPPPPVVSKINSAQDPYGVAFAAAAAGGDIARGVGGGGPASGDFGSRPRGGGAAATAQEAGVQAGGPEPSRGFREAAVPASRRQQNPFVDDLGPDMGGGVIGADVIQAAGDLAQAAADAAQDLGVAGFDDDEDEVRTETTVPLDRHDAVDPEPAAEEPGRQPPSGRIRMPPPGETLPPLPPPPPPREGGGRGRPAGAAPYSTTFEEFHRRLKTETEQVWGEVLAEVLDEKNITPDDVETLDTRVVREVEQEFRRKLAEQRIPLASIYRLGRPAGAVSMRVLSARRVGDGQ